MVASLELYHDALQLAEDGVWEEAQQIMLPASILNFAPFIEDAWQQGPLRTGTEMPSISRG